jgi:hypothetical protein
MTALDKLIEAQTELVEELKLDMDNPDQTLSGEMMQLRELSEQIIVLRHLRQTRFELECNFRLIKSEQFGPLLEQQAS